jgi:hypothetical protein
MKIYFTKEEMENRSWVTRDSVIDYLKSNESKPVKLQKLYVCGPPSLNNLFLDLKPQLITELKLSPSSIRVL